MRTKGGIFFIGEAAFGADEDCCGFMRGRKWFAAAFVAKIKRPTFRPVFEQGVEFGELFNFGKRGALALLCRFDHVRAQPVLLHLIHYAARAENRHETRRAQFAGLFSDPVKTVFLDESLAQPDIGHCFPAAQFCLDGQDEVALSGACDRGQIFARNVIEQLDRCAVLQPHNAEQIMRRIARNMNFAALAERLFDKKARSGFGRPGGGCGHQMPIAEKRPSTSAGRSVIRTVVTTTIVPDSEYTGFVKLLPAKLRGFAVLARFDRPIGWWLLFWPCVFGLALTGGLIARWDLLLWMLLGAVVMRGAGCVYNDIVDRDLDAQVARTALRPLPGGAVALKAAWGWLLLLCMVGLIVLLQLRWEAQLVALGSLVLVVAYPFMKRITWWPQVWLGLVFSWGALVGWVAITGTADTAMWWLYSGTISWVIGYDTVYAMQDREDDALVGIKSSALRLGGHVRVGVALFYVLALGGWSMALWSIRPEKQALVALVPVAIHFSMQLVSLRNDGSNALGHFRSNRMAGLLAALAFLVVGAAG